MPITNGTGVASVAKVIESAGGVEIPKPLESLTGQELARKREIARVSTETFRYLTGALTRKGFEWLLPVVLSKSTDPLWPDPVASVKNRIETEIYEETVRQMKKTKDDEP
jgi:asparaginyl-tRNA synthetase